MASSNTSKTAHVMNLLSKNRGAAETPEGPKAEAAPQAEPASQAQAAPQVEPAVPQAQAAPAHAAPVAPIISSINADAAVSSQIKDALEAELEGQPKAAPAPQTASAQQAASAQQTASVQEPAPVQMAPQAPAPAEAPVQEAPMDLPAPRAEVAPSEEHAYVNVMQVLVEEKADEYMKMFGICCCDKCRVDVRAYALNHLPPKYVVMSEHERVPRLTVYESRFASDITSQLIQACKQVMLTPHHSRKDN